MRAHALCLFIFAMSLSAQADRNESIVNQLNETLLPLKDLPGGGTPKHTEIMARFATEISKHYRTSVVPRDLARTLTSALAGRKLSQASLTPLTRSLIAALDAALLCRDTRCQLGNSERFRVSVVDFHKALVALGVSAGESSIVTDEFLTASSRVAKGPVFRVQPIPPAYPPKHPRQSS